MPTEKYASATEIFGYCQLLGRHFDLYPHALFQTEIDTAEWDDDAQRWQVRTITGRPTCRPVPRHRRRHPAQGQAARHRGHRGLRGPGVPHHPLGLRLHRRRARRADGRSCATSVSASSAPAPRRSRSCRSSPRRPKELYVFQRTPSAVGVRDNGPTDVEWFNEPGAGLAGRAHPQLHRGRHRREARAGPGRRRLDPGPVGGHPDRGRRPRSGRRARALRLRDHGGAAASDRRDRRGPRDRREAQALVRQALQAGLLPRRLPAVVQPAQRAPGRHRRSWRRGRHPGRVVVGGEEYPLDLLVFASGFEVTTDLEQRLGFDPRGPRRRRDERALARRRPHAARRAHGRVPEPVDDQPHPGRASA